MKKIFPLLLAALMLNVGCKKEPDPPAPPAPEPPQAIGTDYYALCTDLLGLSYEEASAYLVGQGYTCTNENQTSQTDRSYNYESRGGNVTLVCSIVARNGQVMAVTAGEQWDYGTGSCDDMRNRYHSLLLVADHRNSPWESVVGTVNDATYNTVADYLEALCDYPITRNCTDGEQLIASSEFIGSTLVVRGAASIKNEQFLSWYTGPSYVITLLARPYFDADGLSVGTRRLMQ